MNLVADKSPTRLIPGHLRTSLFDKMKEEILPYDFTPLIPSFFSEPKLNNLIFQLNCITLETNVARRNIPFIWRRTCVINNNSRDNSSNHLSAHVPFIHLRNQRGWRLIAYSSRHCPLLENWLIEIRKMMDPRVRLLSLSRACALSASLLHVIIAIDPHCKRHFRFIIGHNGLLRGHGNAVIYVRPIISFGFVNFNFKPTTWHCPSFFFSSRHRIRQTDKSTNLYHFLTAKLSIWI